MISNDLPSPPTGEAAIAPRILPPSPLTLLGGAGGTLKKSVVPMKFADYKFTEFDETQSVTERMRQLDKYHFHRPVQEECDLLNLPTNRINLHILKDVLFLSGGLVGARFANEDLSSFRDAVVSLGNNWSKLESYFNSLEIVEKKKPISSLDDPVVAFKLLADEYIEKVKVLQKLVCEKQVVVARSERTGCFHCSARLMTSSAMKFEADPEKHMGRSAPEWLSVLTNKFHAAPANISDAQPAGENQNASENSSNISAALAKDAAGAEPEKKRKFTIGWFSLFLSDVIVHSSRYSNTAAESEALSVLLQASNDHKTVFTNAHLELCQSRTTDVNISAGGGFHPIGSHEGPHHNPITTATLPILTQKYWAVRFFHFLASLPELQSTPKDEKALDLLH